MLRGEAVFDLLVYLNGLADKGVIKFNVPDGRYSHLYCDTCQHHLGQHEADNASIPDFPRCSGSRPDMNRNWCDCDGFALYYCDQPRPPTAEEIYEALQ